MRQWSALFQEEFGIGKTSFNTNNMTEYNNGNFTTSYNGSGSRYDILSKAVTGSFIHSFGTYDDLKNSKVITRTLLTDPLMLQLWLRQNYTTVESGYECEIHIGSSNNITLYQVNAGSYTALGSPISFQITNDTYYKYEFRAVQNTLSLYINDVFIASRTDSLIESGKALVGTYYYGTLAANVAIRHDYIRVYSTDDIKG